MIYLQGSSIFFSMIKATMWNSQFFSGCQAWFIFQVELKLCGLVLTFFFSVSSEGELWNAPSVPSPCQLAERGFSRALPSLPAALAALAPLPQHKLCAFNLVSAQVTMTVHSILENSSCWLNLQPFETSTSACLNLQQIYTHLHLNWVWWWRKPALP